MSRKKSLLEKYLGSLIISGLLVYCIVDFINYYIIFTDYGFVTSFVASKDLSGTGKNKHWDITYNYYANEITYNESTMDISPFSNTFKQDVTFYVYYYNKNPSKHIVVPEKLSIDFSPSILHYLTLDRSAVFYLIILLFFLFINLTPLIWAILYTIVGSVLILIFRRINYKRFVTERKEKIYNESIGRIINKVESLRF